MEPGRRRSPAELWTLESRKERRRCNFGLCRGVALYSGVASRTHIFGFKWLAAPSPLSDDVMVIKKQTQQLPGWVSPPWIRSEWYTRHITRDCGERSNNSICIFRDRFYGAVKARTTTLQWGIFIIGSMIHQLVALLTEKDMLYDLVRSGHRMSDGRGKLCTEVRRISRAQ